MAKAPADIRSLARQHTERAIQVLAGIMDNPASPEASRVAAANSLLDRGWGKPTQPIAGDDDAPALRFQQIVRVIVDPEPEDRDGESVPPAT